MEHLPMLILFLNRATKMNIGTLTLGCLNPGNSFVLARFFPGRNHVVRIRHLDCTCVVINPQFQLTSIPPTSCCGNTTLWPTNPDGIGFLFVISKFVNQTKANWTHATIPSLMAMLPAFSAPLELLGPYSHSKTFGVTGRSTRRVHISHWSRRPQPPDGRITWFSMLLPHTWDHW